MLLLSADHAHSYGCLCYRTHATGVGSGGAHGCVRPLQVLVWAGSTGSYEQTAAGQPATGAATQGEFN